MASGGSYIMNEKGAPVLQQRSGHQKPAEQAKKATGKKVNSDENTQEGATGRR